MSNETTTVFLYSFLHSMYLKSVSFLPAKTICICNDHCSKKLQNKSEIQSNSNKYLKLLYCTVLHNYVAKLHLYCLFLLNDEYHIVLSGVFILCMLHLLIHLYPMTVAVRLTEGRQRN